MNEGKGVEEVLTSFGFCLGTTIVDVFLDFDIYLTVRIFAV
jgi:hypothetical protein